MSTHDHLVAMLNQITRNLAVRGDEQAARDTADHILRFWAPQMRAAVTADDAGLSPIARAAIWLLGADAH